MNLDPTQTHVAVEWPHESQLIACRFDPQGRFVFASGQDNSVQRWRLSDGAKTSLLAHDSWVRAFAFSKDGETLLTAGGDGRLIWWQTAAEAPQPVRTVEAHAGWIRAASVSLDGTLVATGGNDHRVKLWRVEDGSLARELVGHESHVYSVLFHPGGEFVLSGELKGAVRQWSVATGETVRVFDAKTLHSYNGGQMVDFGGVRALSVSQDGKHLACGGLHNASNPLGAVHEPIVLLFEWESQKLVQSHIAEGVNGVIWRAMHTSDFLIGVSGGSTGGFLFFWRPDQNKEFHRFQLPHLPRDGDLHPDGLQLATAHYDGKLRINRMTAKAS